MQVKVRYFGMLTDATKKAEEDLEIPDGGDLISMLEFVQTIHPSLQGFVFKVARNKVITKENVELQAGDELAFLPPFSGG